MNEQRFRCTACGKCCYGWVPLTVREALAQAGRFPLALSWTLVKTSSRAHKAAAELGVNVSLANRKTVAVLLRPVLYLPAAFPCPALGDDKLCGIQDSKPLRCRTMPFDPCREEKDQAALLAPKQGWLCDVGAEAPVLYKNGKIQDPADFEAERAEMRAAAPAYRAYVQMTLKQSPPVANELLRAAMSPVSGRFAVSFWSFLKTRKEEDRSRFAKAQYGVLLAYAEKTKGQPDVEAYHTYYLKAAQELAYLAER